MKTIQIPDKMYQKLKELAQEYTTQENRFQAHPCMFTIRSTIQVNSTDELSDGVLWSDGEETFDEDEARIWCEENGYEFDDNEYYIRNDENSTVLHRCYYRSMQTFEARAADLNVFFTAKAARRYIANDRHNFQGTNPYTYAFTPAKNPEMELIGDFIAHIAKDNCE